MSDPISLLDRVHSPDKVLADLTRILVDEPECARDGVVVILLDKGADGEEYNTVVLTSEMRRAELVSLCAFVQHDQLTRGRR